MNQEHYRINNAVAQKLVSKTKLLYIVLENPEPISYWIQNLPFCEFLGRPRKKMKGSDSRMEDILSTLVLQNNLYGEDTILTTMSVPLVNNPLDRWLGVIIRGSYQEAAEYSRW